MMRPRFAAGLTAAALVTLSGYHAQAQGTYAAVHGTATDATGAVVPNAKVTILNTSTGTTNTATTDAHGYYIFPQLAIGGPYTVTISADGFNNFKSSGLMLNLNDNDAIDAQLKTGSSAEIVDVQAASIQVETSDTQLKQTISSSEILDLPLLGRDATAFQKLSPGVVEASDGRGGFATNGNQSFNNSYMIDGDDVDDGPLNTNGLILNPDAMAQENIITGSAGPQYARNSGATVDQSVKTGTNTFHGSGFEFYRDTFLNDSGYTFGSPAGRAPFHQNVYGGTIGGPVLRDKLFFFVGFQGQRNTTSSSTNSPVFSTAQRAGNFSGDLSAGTLSAKPVPFSIGSCVVGPNGGAIPDPKNAADPANQNWANCLASTGAQIPSTLFNSTAQTLINKYIPASNNTLNGLPYYSFNAPNSLANDQGTIRVDYHPTRNDTIWASSIFQSSPDTAGLPFYGATLPGFTEVDTEHLKLFNASYTHIFNPSTLNEVRINYFRFLFGAVNPQSIVQPSSVGFENINPQDASASIPTININGYATLGFSPYGPQPRNDQNLKLADTFTKVIGSHNLSFGAFAEKLTVENPFFSDNNGAYSFNGAGSFSSGDPALDFLLGVPDSYSQGSGVLIDARAWEGYGFAADNWKATRTLTANIALGYDIETPWQSLQYGGEGITCWQASSATTSVFKGANAPPGLLYAGDPGCNRQGGATIKYNHFSPRVGFAWSPDSGPSFLTGASGSNGFSLRGGFGIYFNRDIEEEALQNLNNPPFVKTSQGAASAGYSPAFTNPFASVTGTGGTTSPFPFTPPAAGSTIDWSNFLYLDLNKVDPNYTVPYVYSFNVNAERALPSSMVLMVGYSGSLGRHLVVTTEADPITAAGHAACLVNPACVNDAGVQSVYFPQNKLQPATYPGSTSPYYLSVGQQQTTGSSNYSGLLVSLQKAPTHGLFFQLSYTYAHGLDNSSGYESASGSAGRSYNYVPGYQYLNYGDSDYDARHRFTAAYDYVLPLPAVLKNNLYAREALGGWSFSGITALQTGFPVNVYQSGDNSLWCDGYGFYGCPDAPNTNVAHISGQNPRKTGAWFPASDFSPEAVGTFGNAKRNFFHGPGFNYSNVNLSKNFNIDADGTKRIQLRLEAYNAFNHANFASPSNNFSSPTFGSITSLRNPVPSSSGDPQPGRAVQLAGKFYF